MEKILSKGVSNDLPKGLNKLKKTFEERNENLA